MNAGKLRHRIAIQRDSSTTQTPDGQHVPNWATIHTVWASVSPVSGSEPFIAEKFRPTVTHSIVMRAPVGVRASDRILFNGMTLDLQAVIDVDARGIELRCLAVNRP